MTLPTYFPVGVRFFVLRREVIRLGKSEATRPAQFSPPPLFLSSPRYEHARSPDCLRSLVAQFFWCPRHQCRFAEWFVAWQLVERDDRASGSTQSPSSRDRQWELPGRFRGQIRRRRPIHLPGLADTRARDLQLLSIEPEIAADGHLPDDGVHHGKSVLRDLFKSKRPRRL